MGILGVRPLKHRNKITISFRIKTADDILNTTSFYFLATCETLKYQQLVGRPFDLCYSPMHTHQSV